MFSTDQIDSKTDQKQTQKCQFEQLNLDYLLSLRSITKEGQTGKESDKRDQMRCSDISHCISREWL